MGSSKRKLEDDPAATSAMSTTGKKRRRVSDADEETPKTEKKHKKEKKDKKEKKSKKSSSKKDKHRKPDPLPEDEEASAEPNQATSEDVAPETGGPTDESPVEPAPLTNAEGEKEDANSKKSKKDKKKKSKSTSTTTAQTPAEDTPTATAEDGTQDDEAPQSQDDTGDKKKAARFIVFVGNLPYAATPEQITAHFSAVHPTSVRLLHEPRTGKSRGIAFVEFARFDHMRTCLKTLHHSTFTCPASSSNASDSNGKGTGKGGKGGKGDKMEERKINVELTAGGGGNTEHRKGKIRAKNAKLNEQRVRQAIAERDAKAEKQKEKADRAGGGEEKSGGVEDSIHPSRRGRVPGGR
ncbi:hypothetical protein GGR54DRAFT_617778 [Hypoxylon sp. NC1633]|nr:hypothetical protein GGR54DRAFT_617778 [Hypoxylon sp. NC1633]